jgi:hypothetical protein
MKSMMMFAVISFLSTLATTANAAPEALSQEEIVKTVLARPVVLEGVNAKGALGADSFALRMSGNKVMRANLRANANSVNPSGGASTNPEAYHVLMNLSTSSGTTKTMLLKFSGRTKESGAHTRVLNYEAPFKSAYAGQGRLAAVVGQTRSADGVWITKSTYVRFLSK